MQTVGMVLVSLMWVLPFWAPPLVARQARWDVNVRKRALWAVAIVGILFDLAFGLLAFTRLNADASLRIGGGVLLIIGGGFLNIYFLGAAVELLVDFDEQQRHQ